MPGRFRRFFRRWTTPTVVVESRREHVASYPPMPPPPPPQSDPIHGSTATGPPARALPARTGRTGRQVKLILADGSESALPEDPQLAARADYFVKSMLPPRPPAPTPDAPSAPQARRV